MTQKYYMEDGRRVYAVGDIHGHYDKLTALEDKIAYDLSESMPFKPTVVYLGDYIDRGLQSREVIEHLVQLEARDDGIERRFLLGNHELGLFEFLKDPVDERWLYWGGVETCASYGVRVAHKDAPAKKIKAAEMLLKAMPEAHKDFLKRLEVHAVYGDYLFAHGGIDPRIDLDYQTVRNFTSMREPFLSWHINEDYKPLKHKVVHGHSIEPEPQNLPHRVGVDTGCFRHGVLTCAVVEGRYVRFLQA